MSNEKQKLSNIAAIKTVFEADGGRKLEMAEIKAMSNDERSALGKMCAVILGVEIAT